MEPGAAGHAARPSGALVYDPGDGSTLSSEQFARLSSEMEAGFAGAARAGRPMLLEGGLKWQALSLTPADMDFVELKAAAAREIALAFGVPPMLLGLGILAGHRVEVGGVQVLGTRAGAIASPSGGGVVDLEARAAIGALLAMARGHGLIAT